MHGHARAHPAPLVRLAADGSPVRAARDARAERLSIEIPHDVNAMIAQDAALGVEWRVATRAAFREAFAARFVAEEFFRVERHGQTCGAYFLRRKVDGEG